jgi:preprotein translocase subunit YajC
MTIAFALLQTAAEGNATNATIKLVFQVGAIIAIMYFILIRPQMKQRRQQEGQLNTLKRGDEIVTAGGIVGEVVHIKEAVKDGAPQKTMEDRITIKSAESRLIVERGRIARVIAPTGDGKSAT